MDGTVVTVLQGLHVPACRATRRPVPEECTWSAACAPVKLRLETLSYGLFRYMLLLASTTLRRFLNATVPPPAPEARPEDWVRLDDVGKPLDEANSDTLAVHLYRVEPSPHMRYESSVKPGGGPSSSALVLDLSYAITYFASKQEAVERALGGVLRAFHTHPTLTPQDYLLQSEQEQAAAQGLALPRLDVSLVGSTSASGEAIRQGSAPPKGLALHYCVRSVLVPSYLQPPVPKVDSAESPSLSHSNGAGPGTRS